MAVIHSKTEYRHTSSDIQIEVMLTDDVVSDKVCRLVSHEFVGTFLVSKEGRVNALANLMRNLQRLVKCRPGSPTSIGSVMIQVRRMQTYLH